MDMDMGHPLHKQTRLKHAERTHTT